MTGNETYGNFGSLLLELIYQTDEAARARKKPGFIHRLLPPHEPLSPRIH
jgi:hypothetical protein